MEQNFALLSWQTFRKLGESESYKFQISGSTGNLYTIIIKNKSLCKNVATVDCNCQDSKSNTDLVCKHRCYILFKVLGLFRRFRPRYNKILYKRLVSIGVLNESYYFDTLILSHLDMLLIKKKYQSIGINRSKFMNQEMSNHYKTFVNYMIYYHDIINNHSKKITHWEKCSICLEKMTGLLSQCSGCNVCFHTKCLNQWLHRGKDCPMCRIDMTQLSWAFKMEKLKDGIVNLMDF